MSQPEKVHTNAVVSSDGYDHSEWVCIIIVTAVKMSDGFVPCTTVFQLE